MIDVFTHKRIHLIVPLKSNRDQRNLFCFYTFCFLDSVSEGNTHPGDSLKFEYLGEIETEFENTLVRSPGAQMGSNHENIEVENLVTHSL